MLDFLLNCGAILLATTLYSSAPALLCVLLVSPAALLCLLKKPVRSKRGGGGSSSSSSSKPQRGARQGGAHSHDDGADTVDGRSSASGQALPLQHHPFVTTYRGCLLVITTAAILAVDFRVFPRRFAKVETWGTSLMDLGVGSFVFSSGLVGARSVVKDEHLAPPSSPSSPSPHRTNNNLLLLLHRLATSAKHSLPLLALGLVRLLSVKSLDYAEHVSEYGVHLNFFFTLSLLPPVFVLVHHLLYASRVLPSYAALALLVGTGYEIVLESTRLTEYVLTAPRVRGEFWSQNREGVVSFLGYLAVFLVGVDCGVGIFRPSAPPSSTTRSSLKKPNSTRKPTSAFSYIPKAVTTLRARNPLLVHLLSDALFWTFLAHLSTYPTPPFPLSLIPYINKYHPPSPSRRLANLPYVLWVAAFNSVQLLVFYSIDAVFFPSSPSSTSSPSASSLSPSSPPPPPSSSTPKPATSLATTTSTTTRTSPILTSFNKNGLPLFLLANLLTGAINLRLNTLEASRVVAMAVLAGYMFVVAGVGVLMWRWGVRVGF